MLCSPIGRIEQIESNSHPTLPRHQFFPFFLIVFLICSSLPFMKILFELSKEHNTLPKSELLSLLSLYGNFEVIEEFNGVIIVKTKNINIKEIKKRITLTHRISKFLFSCKFEELFNKFKNIKIKESFCVRVKNGEKFLERELGNLIKGKVDLENPKEEIRVIFENGKCYIGKKLFDIEKKQYNKRVVQKRPFFSPISIHPKFAKALVNLARVKKGTILDPFCGTGGILIEAGLLNLKVIGSDIEQKMINGCKENLEFYNIKNYKLYCCDIGGIKNFEKVDAIITDPPYGRSATTKKENIEKLYDRTFSIFKDVLKKNKFLSIILPNENSIKIGKKYFELIEVHSLRVHKSLTRNFCVFRNIL